MDRGRNSKAYKADLRAMEEAHDRAKAEFEANPPPPPSSHSSQEAQRGPPPPEHTLHYSEFIPHEPIPIPNAIPKERLPVMGEDGRVYMTESRAPRTLQEIDEMEKMNEKAKELDEAFERLKQGAVEYDAQQKKNPASSSKQPPPRPTLVEDDEDEEPYPAYHKHVMKPYGHQYGHTTASLAYEQGLKDGEEKARQEMKKKEKQKKECRSKAFPPLRLCLM